MRISWHQNLKLKIIKTIILKYQLIIKFRDYVKSMEGLHLKLKVENLQLESYY